MDSKPTRRVGLRELQQFLSGVGAEERALLKKAEFAADSYLVKQLADVKKGADFAEDAYWYQRGARARYPGADAVLNVTPYVGMATNLDDIQRSVRDSGTVEGGDVAGLALNAATTGAYVKGMKAAPALIKTIAQETKQASKGKKGHGAVPMLTAGVVMPPIEYVKHYYNAQQEANAKYGDRPVSDIAQELRRMSKK